MPELFYVQDTRNYVGNCVLWWRTNGEGYTTNLTEAMKVEASWVGRDTDVLWPCDEIEKIAYLMCDMQFLRYVKRGE